jgi:lethal(3)malignant brain tumor-like protein
MFLFYSGYGYIESTNRCGIIGCRGLSNTKYPSQKTHNCLDECPYEIKNWSKTLKKLDRLKSKPILHKNSRQRVRRVRQDSGSLSSNSTDIPTTIRKRPYERESNLVVFSDHPDQKRIRRISNDVVSTPDLAADRKDFDLQLDQQSQTNENPKKSILETTLRLGVTKTFLSDYGPRLKQAHDLWTENSKMLDINFDMTSKSYERNPISWSVEEVADYVSKLPNCADIAEKFEQDEIDGTALLSLTQEDLVKFMGVKLGPAIKVYNRIMALREYINVKFIRK